MSEIENKPLLSVRLMTFNHGEFIEEAIESCLNQKTDFNYEIVIGDDFSTDNTLTICKSYAEKCSKVRVLDRQKGDEYWVKRQKSGRLENFSNILKNCNGKYIALLDGDDYWTDPLKLQKQVDFLRENEDYSAVFHNAEIHNSIANQEYLHHDWNKDKEITIQNVVSFGGYVYPTAALVFRNFKSIQKDLNNKAAGDLILAFELIKNGRMYYMSDAMSVYRRHDAGVYSGILKNKKALSEDLNDQLDFYILQRSKFSTEYSNEFDKVIKKLLRRLLVEFKVPLWKMAKYYPSMGFKHTLKMLYTRIKN